VASVLTTRALARRAAAPASGGVTESEAVTLRAGSLEINVRAHEAKREGRQLALTVKEFDLLVHMMRHPNRAFRRDELLEAVWGYSYGDTATVTVHMRRLREKVEVDPSSPMHLQTVQGVGARFCA
jgi:DNA-binding response OmpR family regulator